ncbi:hypothetical protein GCM10010435_06950 [Winogradskya consettensis]|uniref:Uncharacterized protein n=1 Tax=Winogradskya consettensis TaxID=113560 RepID=A0A919SQP8_9ACTN|nr:hypothetical protein [Actinoplanes consettensis]GIM75829.1 hypothetical protein Aco04nite_47290 [Actinoplanes consettensis]
MTLEIERPVERPADPVRPATTRRTAEEVHADRQAAARRTQAALHIAVVTLAWLVSVPFLVGWGVLGTQREDGVLLFAALLAVVLPFTGAAIATRNGLYFTGGCFAVLTLAMVVPAISVVQAG